MSLRATYASFKYLQEWWLGSCFQGLTALSGKEFFLISKPLLARLEAMSSCPWMCGLKVSYPSSLVCSLINMILLFPMAFYFRITLCTLTLLINCTISCLSNENFRWKYVQWQIQYNCLTFCAKTLPYSQILFEFPEYGHLNEDPFNYYSQALCIIRLHFQINWYLLESLHSFFWQIQGVESQILLPGKH